MEDRHARLSAALGMEIGDPARFDEALTHGSHGTKTTYQRLEFLGDRVLGLAIAELLFERHPDADEGVLSARLNALVARSTCARVARAIGLPPLIRLGRQATDDGARQSDNVAGDVMEAVIGAVHWTAGAAAARDLVRRLWAAELEAQAAPPRHPKAELQEWAAANGRRVPAYELIERGGPDHAPRFRVAVRIGKLEPAEGTGGSKAAAETDAARALLARVKGRTT